MAFGDGVRGYVRRLTDRVGRGLDRLADQTEVDMQADARWQDRSGDARASLEATVKEEQTGFGRRFVLTLGYQGDPQAPHGVFLEKKNAGNFAIVDPTAERIVPHVRRLVREAGALAR